MPKPSKLKRNPAGEALAQKMLKGIKDNPTALMGATGELGAAKGVAKGAAAVVKGAQRGFPTTMKPETLARRAAERAKMQVERTAELMKKLEQNAKSDPKGIWKDLLDELKSRKP